MYLTREETDYFLVQRTGAKCQMKEVGGGGHQFPVIFEGRSCVLFSIVSPEPDHPHTPIFTMWSLSHYLLNAEHYKIFRGLTRRISGCL